MKSDNFTWNRRSHVAIILHCHYWWEFCSRDTDVLIILSIICIKNEKLLDLNNNRSKPEFFRLLWYIFVSERFRTFCWPLKLFIEKFWYNFGTVLYQFSETRTSDRTLILLDQLLKFLGFSIYPLSFFLYSPFKC